MYSKLELECDENEEKSKQEEAKMKESKKNLKIVREKAIETSRKLSSFLQGLPNLEELSPENKKKIKELLKNIILMRDLYMVDLISNIEDNKEYKDFTEYRLDFAKSNTKHFLDIQEKNERNIKEIEDSISSINQILSNTQASPSLSSSAAEDVSISPLSSSAAEDVPS